MITRFIATLSQRPASSIKSSISISCRQTNRTFTTRPHFYPSTMSTTVTDSEIINRLAGLKISHPEVIEHSAVKGGAEWKAELEKIGKGDVGLTKTVCPFLTSGWRLVLSSRTESGAQRGLRAFYLVEIVADLSTDSHDGDVASIQTPNSQDCRSYSSTGPRARKHRNILRSHR